MGCRVKGLGQWGLPKGEQATGTTVATAAGTSTATDTAATTTATCVHIYTQYAYTPKGPQEPIIRYSVLG